MKLPRVSGKKTIDTLLKAGFTVHRIHGSHYILKQSQTGRRVTVPYHREELAITTLNSILKQSSISQETFISLL
ncbi:MAG: type II toxin-antitoxin system HicA family toxin [Dehalococcoidales bacterium]|nr:type II toxin-antitoxin system HicA family toxin [Dehalococcoidales bacterium]